MNRHALILAATALAGIGAMYVEGMLLQNGVHSWGHLMLLSAGGVVALAVVGVASVRLARAIARGPDHQ